MISFAVTLLIKNKFNFKFDGFYEFFNFKFDGFYDFARFVNITKKTVYLDILLRS